MSNNCIFLSALANALVSSILSSYLYAKKYKEYSNDLHRLLAFISWVIACWLIPALLFYTIVTLLQSYQVETNSIFIILIAWIIPVLVMEIYLYKKGYFHVRDRGREADRSENRV